MSTWSRSREIARKRREAKAKKAKKTKPVDRSSKKRTPSTASSSEASSPTGRAAQQRQRSSDAAKRRASRPKPVNQSSKLPGDRAKAKAKAISVRNDRKATNPNVTVGSTVAADTAGARPDRGGSGAAERGANVRGFAGKVTPGQVRGGKDTKAGRFPAYGKKMQSAQDFRSAFASARKSGKKIFTWQGRKYTTDQA